MASGASVGSFAGGFGKALAGILVHDRNAKRQEEQQDEEMRMRADMATLPQLIELAQQNNNWSLVEEAMGRINPDIAKKFKKEGSPFQVLGPLLGGNRTGAAPNQTGSGEVSPEGTPAMLDAQPPLQNQSAIQPATPPPPPAPGSTLFGTAMPTPEQKGERDINLQMSMARRAYQAIKEQDPNSTVTMEDVLSSPRFQLLSQQTTRQAPLPTAASEDAAELDMWIKEQVKNGVPVTADTIGQKRGEISKRRLAPAGEVNWQRMTGVLQGEDADKTRTFFVNPQTRQITEQDGTPVTGTVVSADGAPVPIVIDTPSGPQVLDRGTATTKPIKDAQGKVVPQGPTAEMRNRTAARQIVVPALGELERLGQGVISKVGPAQRADALKRGAAAVLGNDPEWRTYRDARMAIAGNLAVLQQGSRPSDSDIRQVWLPMVPDVFADTSESAAMKWRLIRVMSGLEAGAENAAPAPGAAPIGGARTTPPPTGGGTGLKMDAQGNFIDATGKIVIPAQ